MSGGSLKTPERLVVLLLVPLAAQLHAPAQSHDETYPDEALNEFLCEPLRSAERCSPLSEKIHAEVVKPLGKGRQPLGLCKPGAWEGATI